MGGCRRVAKLNRSNENIFVKRVDKNVIDRTAGGSEEILDEVMGHRPRCFDSFNLKGYRVCLADANPNG